ncbi:MAG: metallophosphoesterase [Synergistales bacterium]|nr:metallophosphoesterase [Synergistales bacterium]
MRLLFTGDWHVGARTWGIDRLPEARDGLEQLLDQAREHRPEAVVVLGDIFHTFRYPGEEAVTLVAATIRRLLDLPSRPEVLLLRGNHDWAGVKVWEILDAGDRLRIVDSPSLQQVGDVALYLLPYLRHHQIPPEGAPEDLLPTDPPDGNPSLTLLAAHLALAGTVPGLTEPVVDPGRAADLGASAMICGHIHRHGPVTDDPISAFYAGPLYRGDFAEEGQDLGSLLADSADGVLRALPLRGRSLHTLHYPDEESMAAELPAAMGMLEDDSWVRISLESCPTGELRLLDRLREEDRRIVRVRMAPGADPEGSAEAERPRAELHPAELWAQYVASEEDDGPRRELVTRAGQLLLDGADPEEVWGFLRGQAAGDEEAGG